MKDAIHVVPLKYDDEGFPVWSTPLTPSENTKRALILSTPDQVIPVIFVPGIMGSNLKLVKAVKENGRAAGDVAWRPDGAGLKNVFMGPDTRQRLLDPINTVADYRTTVQGKVYITPTPNMSLKAAESRGWGSVFWASYGSLLVYLESTLNAPCFYDPGSDKVLTNGLFQDLSTTGIPIQQKASLKLDAEEIGRMSDYWFPVHAVGYNWLQSNEDAGKFLASEIRRIKKLYQNKFRRPEACQKVILVTHSMGGLVSRAAIHPKMGNAEADVLGIVHGVMPAIGAAAAYKRMRTGFEKDAAAWFDLAASTTAAATQSVLGNNGYDVTAVLSHAPGGLQLLPNKTYMPDGWLKVTGVENVPYVIPMNGNPYTSIYSEQNKWWRLINPDWIDPAKRFSVPGKPVTAWASYLSVLKVAENFHDSLGSHYHGNTYCFYGSDSKHASFGTVTWNKASFEHNGDITPLFNFHSTDVNLMKDGKADPHGEDGKGHTGAMRASIMGTKLNFSLVGASDPGDGTVPAVSGAAPIHAAPSCIRTQISLTGIDHQGAYSTKNETVMKFVAYSICKMSKDIK